ncbi:hypothetical protein K474DRAFT_1472238 [Panus rudis PR-1116 ss-1]|nr:hypothetical protein K474DRAFT_1472238 [Panus rudis PR-1116 ss-1]
MRTISAVGTAFLWIVVASAIETFMLDCDSYPDVCDNHLNGITCNGLPTKLHYDAKSKDNNKDSKRRAAIGCGSGNYCSGKGDCDEFPYASTFEGGLSCFSRKEDGYDSKDTIDHKFLSGVTRCVNPSQNSKHGNALQQFYSKSLKNKNSAALYISGSRTAKRVHWETRSRRMARRMHVQMNPRAITGTHPLHRKVPNVPQGITSETTFPRDSWRNGLISWHDL